jgi:RNA polymerase sigma-70 factor, ECF subfamily
MARRPETPAGPRASNALMTALPLAEKIETLPDTELVERIRQGDVRAMELLMRRHNRMLYRTARAILRDDAEAEDAVQEAYLRAYKALPGFRGESKVSTWLVRIAANEALGRRRRAIRGGEVLPLDAIPEEADPKDDMLRVEMRRILEMRIDALPEAYRTVFMLRALEELSVEETAAALQIPEPTVRTRFFRARGLLRESLARDIDRGLEQAFGFAGERCDRIVRKVMEAIAAGT